MPITPKIPPTTDLDVVRAALQDITPDGRTSIMDGLYVALTSTLDQSSRFSALIVGGRVDAARRRYDEALERYRGVAAVSRCASALLGASHAALMIADLGGRSNRSNN